jgi:hypothetical protein
MLSFHCREVAGMSVKPEKGYIYDKKPFKGEQCHLPASVQKIEGFLF